MFGKGKYFIKGVCKYNGVSYREVMPVKYDQSNPDHIICETTNFGGEQSYPIVNIVTVDSKPIDWNSIDLVDITPEGTSGI